MQHLVGVFLKEAFKVHWCLEQYFICSLLCPVDDKYSVDMCNRF